MKRLCDATTTATTLFGRSNRRWRHNRPPSIMARSLGLPPPPWARTASSTSFYKNHGTAKSAGCPGRSRHNKGLVEYNIFSRRMPSVFFSSLSSSSTRTKNKKKDQRLFPEELNIIYDSKCNVCNLEIEFLRRRDIKLAAKQQQEDQHQGRKLRFTDLEDAAGYNPKDPANAGVTYEQGMKSMHAVLANGQVVCGVPVFELAYHQVNLGWLFAVTKIPMIKRIADAAYDVFAKYRTQIKRGESVERLIEVYRQKKTLDQQQRKAEDCGVCNKVTSK